MVRLVTDPLPVYAQTPTEIVRGQVWFETLPLKGIEVIVKGKRTGLERRIKTDGDGVYTVVFAEPEAQYTILVRAIGYVSETREVMRNGPSMLIVANFSLKKAALELTSVETSGQRGKPRPKSGRDEGPSVGGNEKDVKDDGALFSLDPSDLTRLLARTPGVTYIGAEGKYSVLGASPTENRITVDGASFEGSDLPPGIIKDVSLATTTFDPSKGQFSGGQLSISTHSGSNIRSGRLGFRLSGPDFAWKERKSSERIQKSMDLS